MSMIVQVIGQRLFQEDDNAITWPETLLWAL